MLVLCRFQFCYMYWTNLNTADDKLPNHPYATYHHHSAFCLVTGPQPLPKRVLYRVRFTASSFNFPHPHHSLRSSSSCLRRLLRLTFTSLLPSIFHSVTCYRRQFLRKMWPTQLAFHLYSYVTYDRHKTCSHAERLYILWLENYTLASAWGRRIRTGEWEYLWTSSLAVCSVLFLIFFYETATTKWYLARVSLHIRGNKFILFAGFVKCPYID